MKVLAQFLTRNEIGQIVTLKGDKNIKILDERKPLAELIKDGLKECDKHEQTDDIVGFNIVEVDMFQDRSEIKNQTIFAY